VSGDPLKSALAFLIQDLECASVDLTTAVCCACETLDCFDREVVHDIEALQELHSNVRAAVSDAFEEYHWQVPRALRAFREALAPVLAGGDNQ
jgi:hypothetical protein